MLNVFPQSRSVCVLNVIAHPHQAIKHKSLFPQSRGVCVLNVIAQPHQAFKHAPAVEKNRYLPSPRGALVHFPAQS